MAKRKTRAFKLKVNSVEKKDYKIGDEFHLTWKVTNIPPTPKSVDIAEFNFSQGDIEDKIILTKGDISKKEFTWTIPDTMTDGEVFVKVSTLMPVKDVFSETIKVDSNEMAGENQDETIEELDQIESDEIISDDSEKGEEPVEETKTEEKADKLEIDTDSETEDNNDKDMVADLTQQVESLTERLDKANEERKKIKMDLDKVESKLNICKKLEDDLVKQISELKSTKKSNESDVVDAKILKTGAETDKVALENELKNITEEKTTLKLEFNKMQGEKETAEKDYNEIQNLLQKYDADFPHGIKFMLGEYEEVLKTNKKLKKENNELEPYKAVKEEYDGRYKQQVDELKDEISEKYNEKSQERANEKRIENYKEAKDAFEEKLKESTQVIANIKEEQVKLNEAYEDTDMIWTTAVSSLVKIVEEKKQGFIRRNGEFITYDNDEKFIKYLTEIAKDHKLYFDMKIYYGMIAAMRSSKLIILKGLSGSGKSTFPKLLGGAFGIKTYVSEVQSNWRTKQDLLGFFNHFSKKFMPTDFTKHLVEFGMPDLFSEINRPINTILLDEMNLSKVEWYFADFLSAMFTKPPLTKINIYDEELGIEKSKILSEAKKGFKEYAINGNIPLPENLWFFGSINEDESTQTLSSKVYDRAQVFDFQTIDSKADTQSETKDYEYDIKYSFDSFNEHSVKIFNKYHRDQWTVFNEFFVELSHILMDEEYGFGIAPSFRDKVQMERFFATYHYNEKWKMVEALDLQLTGRILPKLEFLSIDKKNELLDGLLEKIQSKKFLSILNITSGYFNDGKSDFEKGIKRIKRNVT